MTVKQGADQGVACPTMASALDQRFVSFLKDDRTAASEILTGPTEGELLFFYSCLFFRCPHPLLVVQTCHFSILVLFSIMKKKKRAHKRINLKRIKAPFLVAFSKRWLSAMLGRFFKPGIRVRRRLDTYFSRPQLDKKEDRLHLGSICVWR